MIAKRNAPGLGAVATHMCSVFVMASAGTLLLNVSASAAEISFKCQAFDPLLEETQTTTIIVDTERNRVTLADADGEVVYNQDEVSFEGDNIKAVGPGTSLTLDMATGEGKTFLVGKKRQELGQAGDVPMSDLSCRRQN